MIGVWVVTSCVPLPSHSVYPPLYSSCQKSSNHVDLIACHSLHARARCVNCTRTHANCLWNLRRSYCCDRGCADGTRPDGGAGSRPCIVYAGCLVGGRLLRHGAPEAVPAVTMCSEVVHSEGGPRARLVNQRVI